jgi:membrane protease YdiL (CAAX protease family)
MSLLHSVFAMLMNIADYLNLVFSWYISAEQNNPFAHDTSIEGMRSQEFSVGMFYFLAFCIFVFTVIVLAFMFKGKQKNLKTGEKVLFIWILLGVVAAVIFAATQMLDGYLF